MIDNLCVCGNEPVERVVLPGGTRLIVEHVPQARSVALGVWIEVGSRHDPAGLEGVSHFIEHLLFKGTPRRTALQISEELDSVGGTLNAFTAKEHTCVYAKVLSEDFGLMADVLQDMVTQSIFREDDVSLERGVILEEINTYEDAPEELVMDLIESIVWHNHSMGKPILGTSEAVQAMARQQIIDFYRQRYRADQIVVTCAGNVETSRVLDEFGPAIQALGVSSVTRPEPPLMREQRISKVRVKQVEQVHLCIGTEGLTADDRRQYSLHVLNNILGGGPSSRLFQKVREERGLAYSVYSFHSSFRDTGIFGVYAACNPCHVPLVRRLIGDEIKSLVDSHVLEAEIERAKRQLRGSLLLGLEGMTARMMRLGRSELLVDRIVPLSEVTQKIQQVTRDDVLTLAQSLLHPSRLFVAMVGPDTIEIADTPRSE